MGDQRFQRCVGWFTKILLSPTIQNQQHIFKFVATLAHEIKRLKVSLCVSFRPQNHTQLRFYFG